MTHGIFNTINSNHNICCLRGYWCNMMNPVMCKFGLMCVHYCCCMLLCQHLIFSHTETVSLSDSDLFLLLCCHRNAIKDLVQHSFFVHCFTFVKAESFLSQKQDNQNDKHTFCMVLIQWSFRLYVFINIFLCKKHDTQIDILDRYIRWRCNVFI